MSHQPNDPDDRGLTERELAVERLLDERRDAPTDDPQADSAVRLQGEINNALRRTFAPPTALPEFLERLREEAKPTPPAPSASRRTRLPGWAVAAVLLIGLGAWLFTVEGVLDLTRQRGYAEMTVAQIYRAELAAGFEPDWFCEDEKRFAETFAERQGEGVWLRPLPEGVRMTGLAYLGGLAPTTTSLLARVDDTPVLVFVEQTDRLKPELLKGGPGVNVFTSELGPLTAVEVTPLEEPRVAPSLYLRAPPEQPTGRVPGASAG